MPFEHRLHLANGRDGKMKYRKPTNTEEDETAVLNEVHIYIASEGNIVTGPYTLALDKVKKTEIIEKDKQKTKKNHALGTGITISASVLVAAGAIAIAVATY